MSIQITSTIWKGSVRSGSRLLMLLALGDNANDEGICWPLVNTLAYKCRVKERAAQTILAHLQRTGDIYYEQARGRAHSNRFCLVTALDPDQARRTLSKWFGLKPKQVDAILKRVQSFASIRAQQLDAKPRDKFEEQVREIAREAQSHVKKTREFAPRTVINSHQPSGTISEPSTTPAPKTRAKTRTRVVAADESILKSLDQLRIEEPTRTELAQLPHVSTEYLDQLIKHADRNDHLGVGFYVQQIRAKWSPPRRKNENWYADKYERFIIK